MYTECPSSPEYVDDSQYMFGRKAHVVINVLAVLVCVLFALLIAAHMTTAAAHMWIQSLAY